MPRWHDAEAWAVVVSLNWRTILSFDMLMFGLRLGKRPRAVISTTPKPTKLVKDLLSRVGHDGVLTGGSTFENRANLALRF